MIAGTKNNIKDALEDVQDGEICVMFIARNPMTHLILKSYYTRCSKSGRCLPEELDEIKAWVEKFEQYPNKEPSLLFPMQMGKKTKESTMPPEPEKDTVMNQFDEDRKELNKENESDESDESDMKEKSAADKAVEDITKQTNQTN